MDVDQIIQNSKASQDKYELKKVYEYLLASKPKVIVEVGTWRGDLLATFKQLFTPEILIGIESDAAVIDPANLHHRIIIGDSSHPETLSLVSKELMGREIDYLFIDGDHTYEGVKRDFETYKPLVRKGGVVGFHDIALVGPNKDGHDWWSLGLQVNKYWKELKPNYNHIEIIGSGLATGTGLLFL